MNPTTMFLTDVLLTAIVCAAIVTYLKKHLCALLIELCGTKDRASFWLAFCNVMLVLVPLIFVLGYVPEFGPNKNTIIEMAGQLR